MLAATFMLTSHASSAIADQSDKQIATLQQAISDKQTQLNTCSAGMMTRCINPRTKELNDLQAQLTAAQAGVSPDVIEAKDRAATWDKLAKAVGSTPEELQVKLAFARAILLEIVAPIFVSLFLSRYRNKTSGDNEERLISPEPLASNTRTQPLQQQTPPVQTGYKVSGLKW
jgi:fructoselysine-6-P-deglycase FrlB-like protein